MPEGEIVRRLAENHREFLRFLTRRVGDRAVAEDLLQEAFVRAAERGGEVRKEESATAWFYRVLRNAVVDHARREGASRRALAAVAAGLDPAEPPEAWRAEACRCVLDLAGSLKPEYEEALRRIDVEGVPVADFAKEAGISAGNAGVRVFRARAALRKRVAESCRTCAEHGCFDCSCGEDAPPQG